jgi:hypothetical protein
MYPEFIKIMDGEKTPMNDATSKGRLVLEEI